MNFFDHQDNARRKTKLLVVLMAGAVASLIAITSLLVLAATYGFQLAGDRQVTAYDRNMSVLEFTRETIDWQAFGMISLGVIVVVALGSLYKLMQLGGGGRVVAEAMGGRLLNPNTRDAHEKKVLNVVEEMAIASGTPVPPVYLIDEDSINAFAAGFNPQDAVIGVTRGCIKLLSRDELQGVIAHEFSHILHGDMRLNIRLVGILHGILLIGLIGYFLMRSMRYRSYSRRGNNAAAIMFMGLGLVVIGYAGTFFGNIIKAAVSRQREFLADASAVQFTRNPTGISGALKKLGGYSAGSVLHHPKASEFSHMYFGQGIVTHLNTLMATHPPLRERIKRIEPGWDGKFSKVSESDVFSAKPRETSAALDGDESVSAFSSSLDLTANMLPEDTAATLGAAMNKPLISKSINTIGAPSNDHVNYARNLLRSFPESLSSGARDPFCARAIIYSLLLDKRAESVQQRQWQFLHQHAHPAVYQLTQRLSKDVASLQRRQYLPLLDLCVPALKMLSKPQYHIFKRNLVELIRANNKVDLFEWSLYRIIIHNLKASIEANKLGGGRLLKLSNVSAECQQLLSVLAFAGSSMPHDAKLAFERSMKELEMEDKEMLSAQSIQLSMLDKALEKLCRLKPLQKPKLLKALTACITADDKVTEAEAELFRAIADSLDCPVPPILAS